MSDLFDKRKISFILTAMERLLRNAEFSDFKIVCEDQTFPCHRVILANHSEVLSKMTDTNNWAETKEKIWTISDFKPETVKMMLHFIYCHQLPEGGLIKSIVVNYLLELQPQKALNEIVIFGLQIS